MRNSILAKPIPWCDVFFAIEKISKNSYPERIITAHVDAMATLSASCSIRCAPRAARTQRIRSPLTVTTATTRAAPRSGPARLRLRVRATAEDDGTTSSQVSTKTDVDVDKELKKNAAKIAGTFAPRSSTAKGKNPAFKGSALYTIFEVQAYLSLVVGSMLSYNVLLPSDEPNIARLMGMWSVWMFAVPSLRARECDPKEKDALNFLFIAIPLINVLIPIVWKSFGAVFTADCALMAYMYYNKGAGIFDDGSEAEEPTA